MMTMPEISVVICTRNRADSLRETLPCLGRADRSDITCEIVVVDNGSVDHTSQVVDSLTGVLPLRYLFEPRPGKCHALNRALDAGGLGSIVAFLDDDMSPHDDWFQGVLSSCRRNPDYDIFTGPTYIVWPPGEIPTWARQRSIHGWAYSVAHSGAVDQQIPRGEWATPNHFWLRTRILSEGQRFTDMWATEPQFLLALSAKGIRTLRCVEPAAGHRIQPELLTKSAIQKRAGLVGRSFANVSLRPHRLTRPAHLFKKHPVLTRLFCIASLVRWSLSYGLSRLHPSPDIRFVHGVSAYERLSYFLEILRIASTVEAEWKIEEHSDREEALIKLDLDQQGRASTKPS